MTAGGAVTGRPKATPVGVIGGSGLYQMPGLTAIERRRIDTPFGTPSDEFLIGELDGRPLAFLPRHGRGHTLLPSELNFRANIYAFKMLGVERLLSAGAVGSLREDVHPLDVVVPDQYIDRTRGRASTFFGGGIVAHVAFGQPLCPQLRGLFLEIGRSRARLHDGGTYVCMEGPAFSTRAESELYRSWGASVIGMTSLQEAKLAREAEICYATLALVTDYDCWHETAGEVSVEQIVENLHRNAETALALLGETIRALPARRSCACGDALSTAIITSREAIPAATRTRLAAILDRHLGAA